MLGDYSFSPLNKWRGVPMWATCEYTTDFSQALGSQQKRVGTGAEALPLYIFNFCFFLRNDLPTAH